VEDAYDNLMRAESLKPHQTGLAEFRERLLATGVARLGAYRQAYASHPGDPNAALRVARLYEKMGERDKALDVLHNFRAHHPDNASVLFQIASWTEHSPWHLRALRYYELGLLLEDKPAMRLRYAQLLGEHQVTSQDAAEEFERVLQREPGNAMAHLGAAKAYAWYGDHGRALYHARRAVLYRPDLLEAQEYVAELRQGEESQWSMDTRTLAQPGGDHGLDVFQGTLHALVHEGPAFVLTGGAGGLDYSHQGDEAEGGLSTVGWRYRDHTGQLFEGQAAYYVLGRNANALTGLIQFSAEKQASLWRMGFQRDLVYDSYLSLVGQEISGQRLGAARSNLFFADFGRRLWGMDWSAHPFGGWVKAESLEPNLETGVVAGVRKPLVVVSSSSFAVEYQTTLIHFAQDQSGFLPSLQEPFPGGYFSPDLYAEQLPRLVLALVGDWQELRLAAGPPFQYIQTRPDQSGAWQIGAQADLAYLYRFSDQWNLRVHPSYTQIKTVYSRFVLEASLVYIF
jgi:tetratricopeptide (TPR) repeat protein